MDDYLLNVEYENFSDICFKCGRVGHNLDVCPSSAQQTLLGHDGVSQAME